MAKETSEQKLPKGKALTVVLLDRVKTKAGRLIRVWNTNRKSFSNANLRYIAVWVEDANGKNERCLLFTESQIKAAEDRAKKNREDLTKKTFVTDSMD